MHISWLGCALVHAFKLSHATLTSAIVPRAESVCRCRVLYLCLESVVASFLNGGTPPCIQPGLATCSAWSRLIRMLEI
jgi:hypothetical protein